jgi:hypothetical protein
MSTCICCLVCKTPRRLLAAHGSRFLPPALLDDHLIASCTLDEHLRTYFQLLQDNGLQINPAKCVFAVAEVDFLGHRVSVAGILQLPKHVEALQRLPVPTDVKGLQRFLGRFLPGIAAPLLHATSAPVASPSATPTPSPAAADTLATSQPFIAAIPELAAFAAAQRTCPVVGLMRQSPSLDIVCRLVGTEYLFGGVSTPSSGRWCHCLLAAAFSTGCTMPAILVYEQLAASSPPVLSGLAWHSRSMSGLVSALPVSEPRLLCTHSRRRRRSWSRLTASHISTLTWWARFLCLEGRIIC